MTNQYARNISLAAMAMAAVFTGCGGGGGGGSPGPSTSALTGTPNSAQICSTIQGCSITAAGYQFPDGNGGEVVCANGSCVDQNNGMSTNYSAGYNQGYSDGQAAQSVADAGNYNAGYNQGYSDGTNAQAAADAGNYNAGYNDGYNAGYSDGYTQGYSDGTAGYSVAGDTKDVDLQKANLQLADDNTRAQNIANQFSMSFDKALQLTQLSDKVQQMTVQGQVTADDRAAITNSALSIAGVTPDEVNSALSREIRGDSSGTDAILTKAATNLGMPSAAALRDQLLPALGVNL